MKEILEMGYVWFSDKKSGIGVLKFNSQLIPFHSLRGNALGESMAPSFTNYGVKNRVDLAVDTWQTTSLGREDS